MLEGGITHPTPMGQLAGEISQCGTARVGQGQLGTQLDEHRRHEQQAQRQQQHPNGSRRGGGGWPDGRAADQQRGCKRSKHSHQQQQQQQQQKQQKQQQHHHHSGAVAIDIPERCGTVEVASGTAGAACGDGAEDAQRCSGQSVPLRVEPPVPLQGVPCDLPRVAGKLPLRPVEPLTPQALAALGQLDAATHDLHIRLLRFDDQLAELASRRGLLVRFIVRGPRAAARRAGQPGGTAQAHSGGSTGVNRGGSNCTGSDGNSSGCDAAAAAAPVAAAGGTELGHALVVEAPELMTVDYLKRRVARAKLMRGEFLPTSRFVLRKPVVASESRAGCSSGGEGRHGGLEDLPSCLPSGEEVFLASLGYEAPGPYELYIASAPQTTDHAQQEQMMSVQPQHAQQPRPHAAAAASWRASAAAVQRSAEVQDARLRYQALLQVQQPQALQGQGQGSAAGSIQVCQLTARVQHAAGRWQAGVEGQQAQQNSGACGVAAHVGAGYSPEAASAAGPTYRGGAYAGPGAHEGPAGGQGSGRRAAGRWATDEVAALVEGVAAFGTSWAKIYGTYVRTGRINPHRTQVDLKDKWRNLLKVVAAGPARQARSSDLPDDLRQAIWTIVHSTGSGAGQEDGGPAAEGDAAAGAADS